MNDILTAISLYIRNFFMSEAIVFISCICFAICGLSLVVKCDQIYTYMCYDVIIYRPFMTYLWYPLVDAATIYNTIIVVMAFIKMIVDTLLTDIRNALCIDKFVKHLVIPVTIICVFVSAFDSKNLKKICTDLGFGQLASQKYTRFGLNTILDDYSAMFLKRYPLGVMALYFVVPTDGSKSYVKVSDPSDSYTNTQSREINDAISSKFGVSNGEERNIISGL